MSQVTPIAADATVSRQVAAGMTGKVVRGSLWSLGGQGATALASLSATPLTIRLLGTDAYGVLTLVNLVIGYLAFADLGMGIASTKYGSEAYARSDDESEAAVVWTALMVSFVPSLLAALLMILAARPLVEQVLRLPLALQSTAILALRIAALGFVARTLSGVLNTPQLIRLRMDLYTIISAGSGVAQILLVPVALLMGGNLVTAVVVTTGLAFISLLAHAAVSMKLQPRLLHPTFRWTLARPLARFGSALVLSAIVAMLLANAEKLLLTRFSSIATLAHYAVAFTCASLLTAVPTAMSQSLFPAFSQLHATADQDALQHLCTRAMRSTLLWVAPAVLFACLLAKPFFTLWAGPEFGRESTLPFYILIGGLVFGVAAYIPFSLILAWGKPNLIARYHLLELIPYLIGAAIFTYLWGAAGAALAWSLRVIVDAGLFFRAASKLTSLSFSPLPNNQRGYALALSPLLLAFGLSIEFSDLIILQCAMAIFSLIVYIVILWRYVLSDEEKLWLKSWNTLFSK